MAISSFQMMKPGKVLRHAPNRNGAYKIKLQNAFWTQKILQLELETEIQT